jgi:hypothetical protein
MELYNGVRRVENEFDSVIDPLSSNDMAYRFRFWVILTFSMVGKQANRLAR